MSPNDLAPWAGVAAMLVVWWLKDRRDLDEQRRTRAKDEREAIGVEAADRLRLDRFDILEDKTQQHFLECVEAHTQHTMAIKALAEGIGRLERAVAQLQSQIRNVATGSADTRGGKNRDRRPNEKGPKSHV